jgi:HK97 family phage prohead protease
MLRFELQDLDADPDERTIEGTIVPYGEIGTIQGVRYRFAPGSVRAARARTPLLVDHDRSQPIGTLAELVDSETGLTARFKVDATPAGDTALVQAASGSRGSLSVGAELVEAASDGDITNVSEALLLEASLLALGAFPSANVTRVAAEADGEPEPLPEKEPLEQPDEQEELDTDTEPAPPAETEEETMEAAHAAPVIMAGADRSKPQLLAGELVQLIVRAQHGEPDARRYLEAALTESISTDLSGVLPPSYESSVMASKQTARPLYNAFRSRPLPGVGLVVNKPRWVTPPDGAWAATVDADATSTKVTIGSDTANVERWDWAGAIPYVVVERSSPDVIDMIYAEAVQDFYFDVETRIAALLAAAATNAATSIGGAVAAYFTLNHRNPEAIIVAPDVWGKMADQKLIDATRAAGDISMTTDGMAGSWAGLPVFVSGSLAATFGYLVTRRAIDARVTEPVRLTANAIGALNVELAVVGEGLFDVDYANEIMELAPTIPVE